MSKGYDGLAYCPGCQILFYREDGRVPYHHGHSGTCGGAGKPVARWSSGLEAAPKYPPPIGVRRGRAKRKLHQHVASCSICSGPHDGCDEGQQLESDCIDRLNFDPYVEVKS